MSDVNNLPTDIPPTTSEPIQIDLFGNFTKKRYLGEFVCRIPTLKDQSMIGRHESMLNGEFPIYLDPGVKKLHKWISHLKYTLVDFPSFWRDSELGFTLRDPNVVEAVYEAVIAYENKWYDAIWVKDEADSKKED